ncbi:hypothetical protein GCM10011349_41920 [Novosphingobium indicum]|uniref:PPM-type phosphatase domain-containing protein n=1 Tax=Novosphingobium indicum TaxID=462949 RepID=A0ABQ2JXL1_9SPHN|nr:PP2C family serine/threonine-protein phosphatase [Novosphingobium indicum]GGN60404.1 hypothetical protein GCM10011349_41920 [Novosphingobium indicum]
MTGKLPLNQELLQAIEGLLGQVELIALEADALPDENAFMETIRDAYMKDGDDRDLRARTLLALASYWEGSVMGEASVPQVDEKSEPALIPHDCEMAEPDCLDSPPNNNDGQDVAGENSRSPAIGEQFTQSSAEAQLDSGAKGDEQIDDNPAPTPPLPQSPISLDPIADHAIDQSRSGSEEDDGSTGTTRDAPNSTEAAPDPNPAQPGIETASPPVAEPIVSRSILTNLPNARVGTDYSAALGVEGARILSCSDDGGSGLEWLESEGRVKGKLDNAGDFKLIFQALIGGVRTQIVANLAVIPDPKSLWVSKPSDQSDPYWKPDEAFLEIDSELFCVAASKRGRSHAREGGFRDDDFGMLSLGGGDWHIAVVADGAGSAKRSRRGSKIAVETVLDVLPNLLKTTVSNELEMLVAKHLESPGSVTPALKSILYKSLAQAAFKAAVAIETEAQEHALEATAYYTTLIIGACKRTPHGWFFGCFAIGDGGAALFDLNEKYLMPLTAPDGGEFAGQTRFLQRAEFSAGYEEIAKRIFFDIRQEFTAFALMTDGITDPKFATDVVFANPEHWVDFWVEDLSSQVRLERGNTALREEFLNWMDFWSAGNHDDRTLAILVP